MNKNVKFTKMHGLGNDFIVIDMTNDLLSIANSEVKWLCDRHFGIGADQLLLIEKPRDQKANYDYRVFNSDGQEVEYCGNGARCVVKYLYTHYDLKEPFIILNTHKHLTKASYHNDEVIVEVASPDFRPESLPCTLNYNENNVYSIILPNDKWINFGIVSVFNPHVVIKMPVQQDLSNEPHLAVIAKSIQESGLFPHGVNVNFYYVNNRQTIHLRTFERGCGFTNACGSGAFATSCYAILQNETDSMVKVIMPGGELAINWQQVDASVIMQGSATEVFSGTIVLPCSF